MGRAMNLLHSRDANVVRRTIRRLHIRFWHASAARLEELLRHAGAPVSVIAHIKEIVNTCRICRMWTKPRPKAVATTRLSTAFNEIVQWDILFHRKIMVSHLIDEAIRWTTAAVLTDKEAVTLLTTITVQWLQPYGAMQVLVTDREAGLVSEEVAQWLGRWSVQLKPKAPGEHAQIVERHHAILRALFVKVEAQLAAEGIAVPFAVIVAECTLAKNVLTTIGGFTPYTALYGRSPPMMADFEPGSETKLDDSSGGVEGYSRHHLRLREVAVQSRVELTAKQRLTRALNSKTRVATEQLELEVGDQVDFHRTLSLGLSHCIHCQTIFT